MRSPRHLWSGDWRQQSDEARAAAAEEREREQAALRARRRAAQEAGEPEPSPSRFSRAPVLTAVVAGLTGAIVAAGVLLAAGGDPVGNDAAKTLPAVAAKPIQPNKGQTRAGAIYALASPAVVSIRTQTGSGTGFLIDDRSTLVTNAHVVGSANEVVVRFGQDGRNIPGQVRGVDASSDLAVVRIPAGSAPGEAKPLRLADSREVQVGDTAIAIGNPFGLDRTATEGIVSALGREIQAPNGFQIDQVIQTDAPINPGNSGGPLLDITGRVIGVNSQIANAGGQQQGGNVGIGFAVPSNTVRQVVPTLERGDSIRRPWLGVETTPSIRGAGAEITSTVPNGPAEQAGLLQGDVIDRVDGEHIDDSSDVSRIVNAKQPGQTIKVHVVRGGTSATLDVKLGDRPARVP